MSVAIVTKYHSPTNTTGARISARMTGAGTAWIPYPHELSGLDVHAAAAAVQMARAGWPVGRFEVGELNGGYVFVRVSA